MEINGLPLHALVVHAAVVFGPLAAVAAVLYGFVPRWREWLRWPVTVLAAVALAAIWTAFLSGREVEEANPGNYSAGSPLNALFEEHEERAELLRIFTTLFAVATFAAAWFHTRTGATRIVLSSVMSVLAVLTLVWTVLTGDAGAKIGWFGIQG